MKRLVKAKKAQELRELKKIWYAKLKEDYVDKDGTTVKGFVDIESKTGIIANYFTDRRDRNGLSDIYRFAKAEYYRLAERFLNEYEFENQLDKIMWEYHVNAISYRDIAITLDKLAIYNLNGGAIGKDYVLKRIKPLIKEMKNRYLIK